MWVLENQIPYIPATVYHDPDLDTPWTTPIQFLGNGTLPNDIYFESEVVYRLEFRQHIGLGPPTQSDPLIYLVENYVAGEGGSTPIDTLAFSSTNQITNPQFAFLDFTIPLVLTSLTNPDPVRIGPGWYLELQGTGSATIQQVPLNDTSQNPSNAPYALRLTLNGWSSDGVFLRQRFYQNGMLWANKIVSSTLTAKLNGSPQSVSASLIDSNASVLAQVLDNSSIDQDFNEFTGYGQLPATTNPDIPPASYIDYKLALPSNIDIYVTSIQLVVQDLPLEPAFEQDSINRQLDHTFNAYKGPLFFKPIPSYLIGWDFPLNPSQVNGDSLAPPSTANTYVMDQTILFQSIVSTIGMQRAMDGAMALYSTDVTNSSQAAIVQYLPQAEARDLLNHRLSVNVEGDSNVPAGLIGTVSLWYSTNANVPTLPLSLITTLDIKGHPSAVVSGWNEIKRQNNLGPAQFTLQTNLASYGFNGWDMRATSAVNTATYFAIVVGTAPIPDNKGLSFHSVSVVPGDIPTIPAPQSYSTILSACQRYYEKSYPSTVLPGTNTADGSTSATMLPSGGISQNLVARQFDVRFNTQKWSSSGVCHLYAQDGTVDNVTGYLNSGAIGGGQVASGNILVSGNWTPNFGRTGVFYPAQNVNNLLTFASANNSKDEAYIAFNYIVESRIGVVPYT
jgi:hypothetical protein